jgi:hypothetical protein
VPTVSSVKAAWKASAVSFNVFPSTWALRDRYLANADFELRDKEGDDGNDEISYRQTIVTRSCAKRRCDHLLRFYLTGRRTCIMDTYPKT